MSSLRVFLFLHNQLQRMQRLETRAGSLEMVAAFLFTADRLLYPITDGIRLVHASAITEID